MNNEHINNTVIIDDGTQEYNFKNNAGEVFASVTFNPSDTGLFERYKKVASYFESYDFSIDEKNPEESIIKIDNDVKEQFNVLLNKDVAASLFGVYTPCTIFANGDLFAEVALKCIGNWIGSETTARFNKKVANIKKYTDKYHK